MASNVLDHVLALSVANNVAEQVTWLLEVAVGVVGAMPADKTSDAVRGVPGILSERESLE